MKKTIHLICNSHIDPVWLWEWEEGAAEAISTFRTAAELCEEFDSFVFNHNEAILYQWVEEYEPALFAKIQRLVKRGKWHIMGGWHLQPDCNMPSGESFVRQILTGKTYFEEKFGVKITTAVNLDPFGHTRGLAQILARSGYDSYLFCRPSLHETELPAPEFIWVGHDGSEVTGTLVTAHYNSSFGQARAKVEAWMNDHGDKEVSAVLWGVGNHGGGPSRKDLKDLARLIRKEEGIEHSTPERYFKQIKKASLPRHAGDLNPWAVGCYTSMVRVKQKHRELENALYMTEKMATAASFQGRMKYPKEELKQAELDLMTGEFHDTLPGSAIPEVEEAAVRGMDHGLEILSRVKARAFYALASGQKKASTGEIPVLVYNPHPHRVETVVECEMEQAEPNRSPTFLWPEVRSKGKLLPSQVEKESSNINEDFRKRVVFKAMLEPASMNRFDCALTMVPRKPAVKLKERNGKIRFKTNDVEVVISAKTGLVDRYRVKGEDYLEAGAFKALVMHDDPDPWGMKVSGFRRKAGSFRLMSRKKGSEFSGVLEGTAPSVRVIEDGPVRSVVEAVFSYNNSFICQQYKLPKKGTEVEVLVRIFWNEKDRMLKLSVPTRFEEYLGQVAYGRDKLRNDGREVVAQKWTAAVSRRRAFTCINSCTYGSDMKDGEIRLSLLRSPAHAAHPVEGMPFFADRRFVPRIDQGERLFRFWFNGGTAASRLKRVESEAALKSEKPFALAFFPPGGGARPKAGVTVSDDAVQVTAFKKAEQGNSLIIRLFEPTGRNRSCKLAVPLASARTTVNLGPFEIKTLRLTGRKFKEVNLLEKRA